MNDRLLLGLVVAVWAVAALLGINVLLPTRIPFVPTFRYPLMLAAVALVLIGLAVLARSWPRAIRLSLGLATAAVGLVAVAVTVVVLVLGPYLPEEPRYADAVRSVTIAEIGVPYQLDVFTHCGFQGTRINGDSWVPVEGSVPGDPRDRSGIFGMNFTSGTVVLTDEDHAVFTTSTNFAIDLRRVRGPAPGSFPCL